MKTLKEIIIEQSSIIPLIEKLKIGSKTKINLDQYEFHPKNKEELKELVDKLIKERGEEADLNDIDTSKITEMNALFKGVKFNGNISKWNVSNVEMMNGMFIRSKFNKDISKWDVSNVMHMEYMFGHSNFNQDISDWNINNNAYMEGIFNNSPLEKNPPKWYKK